MFSLRHICKSKSARCYSLKTPKGTDFISCDFLTIHHQHLTKRNERFYGRPELVGISSSSSSSKPSRIFRNNKIHRAEQRQAFQKILRLDKSAFLLYASTTKCSHASITTSIKRDSRNTIKGGTTQTTPVDPQQQASTHSSRPVNIQLLTSHHYTTRTWKINQPDGPATHCPAQSA
ncbi:uncharacterized protein LOC143910834 [Arctopsyche grandis]|uniref:uncharacterized protein LOC143910834 n=1 Tax=Arctopsyche grandis TaxID=121162 RepID=UPI00406D873B